MISQRGFATILIILAIILAAALIGSLATREVFKPATTPESTPVTTPEETPTPNPDFNSPAPSTGSAKKECQTDKDCQPDEACVQPGPIAIDPRTGQTLTKKTCWPRGAAIPL